MKSLIRCLLFATAPVFALLHVSHGGESAGSTVPWHHPLYLGNQDYWRKRVAITVSNHDKADLTAAPVVLAVGQREGEVPLVGVAAESVRLVNAEGRQVMLRIDDARGARLEMGPIPEGARLTIPNEAPAGGRQRYYLYFDNPSAWPVGEYFLTHPEVNQGGFEETGPYGPLGWELSWREPTRDVIWTSDEKHAGARSLEVRAEARGEPAAFGAMQENLHLIPGAGYTLEAWVKAKDLDGAAGLEVVPANLERTKRELRFEPVRLLVPAGAESWRRVEVAFTAPEGANIMHLRTFHAGTGRFWIDDVRLKARPQVRLSVDVGRIESAGVAESGADAAWAVDRAIWPVRAAIRVANLTDEPSLGRPVYADILQVTNRLYREVDDDARLLVVADGRVIPFSRMRHAILFRVDVPARTVKTCHVYFSAPGKNPAEENAVPLDEVAGNRLADGAFSAGDAAGWSRFGETPYKTISVVEEAGNPGLELVYDSAGDEKGHVIADIEVSHSSAEAPVGVYQELDAAPGQVWLFGARFRCSNVLDRPAVLRARFFDAQGKALSATATLRANPDIHEAGHWTEDTFLVRVPVGAVRLRAEVLNNVDGRIVVDDVFLAPIVEGETGALLVERAAAADFQGLAVWAKSPLERAFPDDLPGEAIEEIRMSAAGNDAEPFQLLLRSSEPMDGIQVKVVPPRGADGTVLDAVEVGVVGYVRINYPSAYIRDFVTPYWRTKLPHGRIGSDGWAGWWADPILPGDRLDLAADETRAVWLEIAVPAHTPAGVYEGRVDLVRDKRVLRSLPLRFQVYDFTLPETPTMKATYVPRFNEREMFGRETTEAEKQEAIWRYMARHKISPEMIRPQPRLYYDENGEPRLDFTEFDKAAERYFNELKFPSTWSPRDLFYLFGWGHPPREKNRRETLSGRTALRGSGPQPPAAGIQAEVSVGASPVLGAHEGEGMGRPGGHLHLGRAA